MSSPLPAKYKYIVVEGPIGAGKTSLAKRLAEYANCATLLEAPEQNPFLDKFYRDMARYALPTQLFFLFQRINQLRDMTQTDLFGGSTVGDFLFDKDPLFAQLTLNDDELALYRQIFDSLKPQAPVPDLVVYLQAEPEVLVERVKKRGVVAEQAISETYLVRLAERYSRFFYHYDASPLLIINANHFNFVDDEEDFSLLVHRIKAMRGKRSYFNRTE
jgi:deoxyguanosine kinase